MARPALILALALVATACTGGDGDEPTTTAAATAGATTEATSSGSTAPPAAPTAGGRLVVQSEDGNLLTILPDGSGRVDLTTGAGELLQFAQPTWSPDGRRVAWTEVDGRDGQVQASLVTARFDGTGRTEADVGFPPFYLYWDPTSSRLAYLGSGATQLEMGILEVAGGGSRGASIDSGQPYYFSWSPDGDRMLVHVGVDRLEFLDLEGAGETVDDAPGAFQAPNWIGDDLVYVAVDGQRQRLVLGDAATGETRTLLEFDGFIQFLLSPDRSQIAFQIAGDEQDGGVVAAGQNAILASAPLAQAPTNSLGLLDVATGDVRTLTLELVVAFFWSPDGRLLSMGADTAAGEERWFRWTVWNGADPVVQTDRFRPSLTFVQNYLPFFEQYAQSMSPWAPDGSAFTFVGATEGGEMGVWVQPAESGASAILVADGVFASWSGG